MLELIVQPTQGPVRRMGMVVLHKRPRDMRFRIACRLPGLLKETALVRKHTWLNEVDPWQRCFSDFHVLLPVAGGQADIVHSASGAVVVPDALPASRQCNPCDRPLPPHRRF